jgi:hypothetical protein
MTLWEKVKIYLKLQINLVWSDHEQRQEDVIVIVSNGTYPWSSVTYSHNRTKILYEFKILFSETTKIINAKK